MPVEPNVSGEKSPFLEPTRLLGLALIMLTMKVSRHLRTRWAARKEPRSVPWRFCERRTRGASR